MICMVTSLNGYKTVGIKVIKLHQVMVASGLAVIARSAYCAAALGTTNRTTCVRLTVTGAQLPYVTSITVFVWSRENNALHCALYPFVVFCYPPLEGLGGGFLGVRRVGWAISSAHQDVKFETKRSARPRYCSRQYSGYTPSMEIIPCTPYGKLVCNNFEGQFIEI